MKYIKQILLGFFLVSYFNMNSQTTTIPLQNELSLGSTSKNTYFKDVDGHLNKFIGTWEYSSNDKYFKIQFYKVSKVPDTYSSFSYGNFCDRLASFIEYKEKQNGQWITIYNTFGTPALTNINFDYDGAIQGYTIVSSNTNRMSLRYTEPTETCRYTRTLKITYMLQLGGGNPQLSWERDLGRYYVSGPPCDNVDESPFKIPANMVLTKIVTTGGGRGDLIIQD